MNDKIINDGGQAFSRQFVDGMSLRDFFFAITLLGMLTSGRTGLNGAGDWIVSKSYELANLMIAERGKE